MILRSPVQWSLLVVAFILFHHASSVSSLDYRRLTDELIFEASDEMSWSERNGPNSLEDAQPSSEIIFELLLPAENEHAKRMIRLNETLTSFAPANSTLNVIQSSARNYFNRLLDLFRNSPSTRFLVISLTILLACTILLIAVAFIEYIKRSCNRRKVKHKREKSIKNYSAPASQQIKEQPSDNSDYTTKDFSSTSYEITESIIVTNPKADELTKNNNDITDETLKTDGYSSTRQKAASQNKDEQQEQQLNRASSLSTLEDSTLNSTAYLINCTNCFSLNRQKSRKSLKKKSQAINKANPRIAVSSSTSISGTKSKNILNKFSLRSPFCTNSQKPTNSKSSGGGTLASRHNQNSLAYNNITTVNNNNNNNASSPMNQRCCLSVSVVPSDKHNAKRRHKQNQPQQRADDDLSDSYSREIDPNRLNIAASKQKPRNSPSQISLNTQQVKTPSIKSNQKHSASNSSSISSSRESSLTNTATAATSASAALPRSKSGSLHSSHHSQSKSNNQSPNESEQQEAIYREPYNSRDSASNSNECIYVTSNSRNNFRNNTNNSQDSKDHRFSVCSLVSSSTVESMDDQCSQKQQHDHKYPALQRHQLSGSLSLSNKSTSTCTSSSTGSDTETDTFKDENDTTSLNSTTTSTASSSTKTNSSCSTTDNDSSYAINDLDELLTIDINCTNHPPTNHSQYKRLDHINLNEDPNKQRCESRSSIESISTTNGEVFNLGLRLNKLRFIDDSASSTALTSPCESIYAGSNKFIAGAKGVACTNNNANNNLGKYFHKQQQQHRFLSATNYGSPHTKQSQQSSCASSMTSSSRTNSQQASCTSCDSGCSTPDQIRAINMKQRPSLTNRLVNVQRQNAIQKGTASSSSGSDEIKVLKFSAASGSNLSKNLSQHLIQQKLLKKEAKQLQHEQLSKAYLLAAQQKQEQNCTEEESCSSGIERKGLIAKHIIPIRASSSTSNSTTSSRNTTLSSSSSSPLAPQAHLQKCKKYQHQDQSPAGVSTHSSNSSLTSSTATADSSSSEYDPSVTYKPMHQQKDGHHAHKQPVLLSHQRINDSANESISSIENTSSLDCNRLGCKFCDQCQIRELPSNLSNTKATHSVVVANKMPTNTTAQKNKNLIKNGVTWTSSTPIMNKLASSDVYQNVTVTTTDTTPASNLVYQRLKADGESKAYAYENFDCINECSVDSSAMLDKRRVSDMEDMNDMDIADGAGNCNFTSNLVEDGFIRMSSPVESVDDLIDLTDDTAPTGDVLCKDVTVPNEMAQLSKELAEVFNNDNKIIIDSNGTNFPNVGSSPVDFNDYDVDGRGCDSVASDGEDNLQVFEDYHQTEEEEEGNVVNDSFADSLVEDSKDFGHQDFDGIILLNQPDLSNKELQSLSDTEEFGSECDDHDLAVEHSVQKRASIMKSSSKFKELDEPAMDTQDSLMFASNAMQGGVASMDQSNEHFTVPTNCSASSCSNSKRAQALHSQHQSVSSAAAVSSGSSKPKVRFNLDINYEKEREWNRVNRIIGDANKSSIEWTKEVEV